MRPSPNTRRGAVLALTTSIVAGVVLAACGGSSATPTPEPTVAPSARPSAAPSPAPSIAASAAPSAAPSLVVAGSPAAGSPGASASPALPDLGVDPDRTLPPGQATWPTSVISATIALAAADREFAKAVGDWMAGGQAQDMELILAAAQGMAFLADRSMANAQRLADYPELATVGRDLVDAFAVIAAAGTKVAQTATAGDAAGFEAAAKDLGAGMAAYATAREPMIDAAELALIMRKGLLVK